MVGIVAGGMPDYPETKEVPCPFCRQPVEIELVDPERGEYEAVPPHGHICGEDPDMVSLG